MPASQATKQDTGGVNEQDTGRVTKHDADGVNEQDAGKFAMAYSN